MKAEVVDGGLLIDCLEVSSNDLKSLITVIRDLILQYQSSGDRDL